MSPPEGGARVDLASLGRLGEALPLDEGSPLIEPAVLVVQAGDWGCCERIEGLATLSAAAARQAPRAAPPSNLGAAAVRAAVSGEADFGDVRERRAPARRRRFFPSLALQIAGGAKAVSLSSCETSAASASASFRNARPRCAAVSNSTAESHASKSERSMVSPFNQVEVTRTIADATRFAISANPNKSQIRTSFSKAGQIKPKKILGCPSPDRAFSRTYADPQGLLAFFLFLPRFPPQRRPGRRRRCPFARGLCRPWSSFRVPVAISSAVKGWRLFLIADARAPFPSDLSAAEPHRATGNSGVHGKSARIRGKDRLIDPTSANVPEIYAIIKDRVWPSAAYDRF